MPASESKNETTARIVSFLKSVGFTVDMAIIEGKTILPGIQLDHGTLLIDEARLLYPGDLLHEAGHVAVTPSAERTNLSGDVAQGPGEEMAAIAWSYAAALFIGLDPAVVFHSEGYRNGSDAILENFREGRYIGVPILQWLGMTFDDKKAMELQQPAYPKMVKWLRD